MTGEAMVPIVVAVVVSVVALAATLLVAWRSYVRGQPGFALVINKVRDVQVAFGGASVMPIIHRAELVDVRVKSIVIERSGKDGLICRDNIRADVTATFFVNVNRTTEDVAKVAQSIGAEHAGDQETLENLFAARFSEALKTVAKTLDFEELYTKRDHFKFAVVEMIGQDLQGYVLDDAAIDSLEQTPVDQLDPNNILDAQGIRKITEITSEARVRTAEIEEKREMELAKIRTTAKELLIHLERLEADALLALRRDTGRELTPEQLEARFTEKLRELVEKIVADRLAAE